MTRKGKKATVVSVVVVAVATLIDHFFPGLLGDLTSVILK